MAQLLSQKLAELESLASSITELLQSTAEQVESKLAPSVLAELAKAKASLQELASTQAQTLSAENQKQIQALQENLQSVLAQNIKHIKSQLLESFTQSFNTRLEALAKDFESTALESLQASLQEPITQAIANAPETKQALESTAKASTQAYLESKDLASLIDYTRFDTHAIAQELAQDKATQALAKATYKEQIHNYLSALDHTSEIIKALESNAKHIYAKAMASDELIKDRYESKLRLLSLKIFGTQELVEQILVESSKLYANASKPTLPPPAEKSNILVVS